MRDLRRPGRLYLGQAPALEASEVHPPAARMIAMGTSHLDILLPLLVTSTRTSTTTSTDTATTKNNNDTS